MTHQQRSLSGNKSKERASSGGKSKPNNFMRLSLPGSGNHLVMRLVGHLPQAWDCWESSSSTEGYPRILHQPQDIILRRSLTDWLAKLLDGIPGLLPSDMWLCRTISSARSRDRTRILPEDRRRRWRTVWAESPVIVNVSVCGLWN